jgi:menaquinone-dependent protoporphyrinogen IX oxidase
VATLGGSGGDTVGSAGRTVTAEEACGVTVLVAAASKYGATAEIAEAIGRVLRESGIAADARPVEQASDLSGYTGWSSATRSTSGDGWRTRRFVDEHADELAARRRGC